MQIRHVVSEPSGTATSRRRSMAALAHEPLQECLWACEPGHGSSTRTRSSRIREKYGKAASKGETAKFSPHLIYANHSSFSSLLKHPSPKLTMNFKSTLRIV